MKIAQPEAGKAKHSTEAMILFAVGPFTFAIPATDVDEIRDLHDLKSVVDKTTRTEVAKVKSTLVRERKTYYVVDANAHFRLEPSKTNRVLVLRKSQTAISVDSIDRIIDVAAVVPLPHAFHGEERRWYRGIALLEDAVVPVVSSAAFLSSAEFEVTGSLVRHGKGAAV